MRGLRGCRWRGFPHEGMARDGGSRLNVVNFSHEHVQGSSLPYEGPPHERPVEPGVMTRRERPHIPSLKVPRERFPTNYGHREGES